MEEIDFPEIKKWLERGDISELASEHGITTRQAGNILSGKSKNFSFVEKAIQLALKKKMSVMAGMNKMKTLNAA